MIQTPLAGPRLDIQLMGPPLVLLDGVPLVVDTRKAVAILALLGAEGRAFARDELAALLWPESDDLAARGALRRTLSTVRSAIGDGPVVIDRTRVDLDRTRVRVDLAQIESAAGSDDRSTLAAAAALARGDFMAGFSLRDSLEFDDWRATRAVAAERAVLAVLDRLATVAEREGDLPAAIDAASRRLDLDPLDEGGHVRLMDLLEAAGDRSGALRQYRACVATLERELGVAPLASTTARYDAIRDRDDQRPLGSSVSGRSPAPASAPDAPAQPGRPVAARGPLVGRDASLDTLRGAYRSVTRDHGRLAAVVGEAGIGKTRLGEELAATVRDAGGVVLATTAYPAEREIAYGPIVDLLRAGLASADTKGALQRLAPAVRGELARLLPAIEQGSVTSPSAGGPGAHARLVAAIADGLTELLGGTNPGLLWIDDIQWLDASTREALEFLLRRLVDRPFIVLLAWRSSDLDAEGRTFVDRVTADPAAVTVQLERLGRQDVAALVAAADRTVAADPDAIDRLMAASEGLPLYVVEALAVDGGGLAGALPSGVRTVLQGRLGSVGETAGQVLSAGSVIGRSFDLATLRHASGRSEDETVDAIDECLRHGLIHEAPAGFDFVHGALRDLAYEAMSLTRRRLLHRRVAEAMRLDLSGSGRDDLARLVLIASHERAAGRDAEAAEAYRQAGYRAAEVFANGDAIAHLSAALALGHPDAGALHATMGRLRTRTGDYAGAIADLEAAAAMSAPAGLPDLEWALGRAHLRRGDLTAAIRHLDAARGEAVADGLTARILVDRSVVLRRMGMPSEAERDAALAADAANRAGDAVAAGAAHRMLGLAALDIADTDRAILELSAALEASAADPDPTARIAALASLAMATASAGSVDAAMAYGDEAVRHARTIGDRHLEAAVENGLADLLHAAGRDEEAMVHLRRAVEAFAEVGGDPTDPDPGIWMLSAS